MAQAIRQEPLTRADRLRELLRQAEERVVSPQDGASDLFAWLDQIHGLLAEMRESGVDLRAERTRWESLQFQVDRRGPVILKAWGMAENRGLAAARRELAPDASRWWWWLDERVAGARRARLGRGLLIALGIAVAVLLAGVILSRLFPVDPIVKAVFGLRQQVERAILAGDIAAARPFLEEIVDLAPDDVDAQVLLGASADLLGDADASEQALARARALLAGEGEFLARRGEAYLQLGALDKALADLTAGAAMLPEAPLPQLLLGMTQEARGDLQAAFEAYTAASDLADAQGNSELLILARTRLANLLQGGVAPDGVPAQP